MKSVILIIQIVFVFTFLSCNQKPNTLTEKEKSEGWELLFDGKTVDNWKMYNGGKVQGWTIEDNCLVANAIGGHFGGDIITKKEYENFEITIDWKTEKGGNSGLMYHVIESKNLKAPFYTGSEYQLLDDTGFEGELKEWQKAGANYDMYVPDNSKKKLNPAGQWNNSKIIFDNGHVEHWLNGKKIIDFEAWTEDWYKRSKESSNWKDLIEHGLSPIGHFCLQDHGGKFWFKNIKVRQLSQKNKPAESLFNGNDLTGWTVFGTEKWWVENGLLVCESGPDKAYGYLGTNRYYKNFDLSLVFNQLSNGNSGVFIRSTVEGTKVAGWQVEVAPKNHDTGGIYESYGRGWLKQISEENEKYLKEGEWNKMRIKVVGNNITTWLNGTEMVNLSDEKIGAAVGRIALQIHDGGGIKIQWKNIKIKEL